MSATLSERTFDHVFGLATQEIAALQHENAALRKGAPPPPRLSDLKPRQQVSIEQLNALRAAQGSGAFDNTPGQKEVLLVDVTGRQSSHFFGDPGGAWDKFSGRVLKTGRIAGPR